MVFGVKSRIQSSEEEIDQVNGKPQDLRHAVLEKWGLRLNQHPPKWSIPGPRDMSLGCGEVQGGGFRREFGCGCSEGSCKGQEQLSQLVPGIWVEH